MQNVRKTIKKAMIDKGMGIPELIRKTGLNPKTVYLFLNKGRNPRLDILEKIMEALDLSIS